MVRYNWVIATEQWMTHLMSFFTGKIYSVLTVRCDSHKAKGSYYFPLARLSQGVKSKIVIFKNRFLYGSTCLKSGGKHYSSQTISVSERQGFFFFLFEYCYTLIFNVYSFNCVQNGEQSRRIIFCFEGMT